MARIEYDVHINGADNGVIIQIGCKTLVFKDVEVPGALADLSTYLTGGFDAMCSLRDRYFGDLPKGEAQTACAPPQCEPAITAVPGTLGRLR
jgi:hypothetical protein